MEQFWEELDGKLKPLFKRPFQRQLEEYEEHFQGFMYIMTSLCGRRRKSKAARVFEYMYFNLEVNLVGRKSRKIGDEEVVSSAWCKSFLSSP